MTAAYYTFNSFFSTEHKWTLSKTVSGIKGAQMNIELWSFLQNAGSLREIQPQPYFPTHTTETAGYL